MKRQAKPAIGPKRGGTAVTFPRLPALPCQQHSLLPGQQGWKTPPIRSWGGMKLGLEHECMTAAGKRGLSLAQCHWHTRGVTAICSVPSHPRGRIPQLQDLIPTVVPTKQLAGLICVPHSPSATGLLCASVLVCRWHSCISFLLFQGVWLTA